MRYYAILNPVAGKGKSAHTENKLRDAFERLGLEGEIVKTISPGDASHLARIGLKKGYTTFLVAGGDGTLFEVVNGLGDAPITIGVLPLGERNLFARTLGFDQQPLPQILQHFQVARHILVSDIGVVNKLLFVTNVGIGLCVDALLSQRERESTRVKQHSLWAQIKNKYQRPALQQMNVTVDRYYKASSLGYDLQIANSCHFFYHEGKSDIDNTDRLLDLFIIDKTMGTSEVRALRSNLMLQNSSSITHIRGHKFTINEPLDLTIQIDGEIHQVRAPLHITIAPFQMRFLPYPNKLRG